MTLVDSNILIDIFSDDPNWFAWSVDAVWKRPHAGGPLLINEIVYAETSIRYPRVHDFDAASSARASR